MAIVKENRSSRYGRVAVDEKGRVVNFREKSGKEGFINAGLYICHRDLLKRLPARGAVSLERDVFPRLGKDWLGSYKTKGFFIDIGTVKDYSRLKSKAGRLALPTFDR
jgi:NDP-sugar pyrophosphorylase family protein